MLDFLKRKKAKKIAREYFKLITGYKPIFSGRAGSIYEMELTRSCIHSFATHVSKLKPVARGKNNEIFERMLQFKPNAMQDTSKWLYQMATIYQVENAVFIIPELDKDAETITGFHNVAPSRSQIVRGDDARLYLKYEYYGNKYAIEFEKIGILSKFLYKNGIFGENNSAIATTLEVMETNNKGIIEGVKNGASIRFFAKLGSTLLSEDVEKERERLTKSQLSMDNNGGIIMLDNKYDEFRQIDSKTYTVDAGQMKLINDNVFSYLNTNMDIIQNTYNSDKWNAYYEGAIEPFAIQLSLVLTNMTFSDKEKAFGNNIIFTANRLQYLTNQEKLNTVTQLFDRGFITHNQGLEIFNMESLGEEGEKRYIRKEYAQHNYEEELNEV